MTASINHQPYISIEHPPQHDLSNQLVDIGISLQLQPHLLQSKSTQNYIELLSFTVFKYCSSKALSSAMSQALSFSSKVSSSARMALKTTA